VIPVIPTLHPHEGYESNEVTRFINGIRYEGGHRPLATVQCPGHNDGEEHAELDRGR
jgi:hypothetical protein